MASHGWRPCPHSNGHNPHHQHHCPHCPLRVQPCPHSNGHNPHHQHHCPHCPLRPHCHHCPLHNPLFHANNNFFQPLPQNPLLLNPSPLKTHPNSRGVRYEQVPLTSDVQISQELEHIELDGEEEDDEPVFVLTDEWRDFFAKSEARRKLEKKQGKKGKK